MAVRIRALQRIKHDCIENIKFEQRQNNVPGSLLAPTTQVGIQIRAFMSRKVWSCRFSGLFNQYQSNEKVSF